MLDLILVGRKASHKHFSCNLHDFFVRAPIPRREDLKLVDVVDRDNNWGLLDAFAL